MFRPGELWPDEDGVHINAHGGGVLFHEGRYYWFGEHKIAGEPGNAAHVGVSVYSSGDLTRWRNDGVALAVSKDEQSPIAAGCILERPKVIRRGGRGGNKFVMWFHLEPRGAGYTGAQVGIAEADKITGPYRFLNAFRPNANHWPANVPDSARKSFTPQESAFITSLNLRGGPVPNYPTDLIYRRDFSGGQMSRDQTLFIDPKDNAAYHFHAAEDNGTLHISRLTDDGLSTTGEYTRNLPGRFHEAPATFYHPAQNKYYLFSSDCTGWSPNAARLSIADHPLGPWRELGNPCRGTPEQLATTFHSQSTFILPVEGKKNAFIFLADRWTPKNAIDGRYIWLPIQFEKDGTPYLEWHNTWDLSIFR